jgi:hypothetical protein
MPSKSSCRAPWRWRPAEPSGWATRESSSSLRIDDSLGKPSRQTEQREEPREAEPSDFAKRVLRGTQGARSRPARTRRPVTSRQHPPRLLRLFSLFGATPRVHPLRATPWTRSTFASIVRLARVGGPSTAAIRRTPCHTHVGRRRSLARRRVASTTRASCAWERRGRRRTRGRDNWMNVRDAWLNVADHRSGSELNLRANEKRVVER